MDPVVPIEPGTFDLAAHYYPRVPNARLHSLVRNFLRLGNDRLAQRYCHLHPEVDPEAAREVLTTAPRWLRWGGADLFHVTNERGVRGNVVVEVNSCPSGQKSMPLLADDDEQGGYRALMSQTMLPMLQRRRLPEGELAVLWDKNLMEVSGYAATLADVTGERVWLVHCPAEGFERTFRVNDGLVEVKVERKWRPIRAALRYVTQRPWTRIPPITRTLLLNPVLACLAGGRNKLVAARAYEAYNSEMAHTGLQIQTPHTVLDVTLDAVPVWVSRLGGLAVVKNPYSNAGQGVWTLTNQAEIDRFMALDHRYEKFIVQALVGNIGWTSRTRAGRLYHVGTMPTREGDIYVADIRIMVGTSPDGLYPVALYARRAREPLAEKLDDTSDSWAMLGTNLSVKEQDGTFTTEPDRLLLMDDRDFNRLGIGVDDLVEAYIQTAMAITAIDRMADRLVTQKGRFRNRVFSALNDDEALLSEILS